MNEDLGDEEAGEVLTPEGFRGRPDDKSVGVE